MALRHTETNSADDSSGLAFGLEGNLYLSLVITFIAAIGLAGLLGLIVRTGWTVAAVAGVLPLLGTTAWIVLLKHGKPSGYDRDRLDELLGGSNFTRHTTEQEGLG